MNELEIKNIIEKQKEYFASGATLPLKHRKQSLMKLKNAVIKHETEINSALKEDLGKSRTESYMCEIGMTLSEISYMIKHLNGFAKEKTVITPIVHFASHSYIKKSPYGTVLIMSPWNYPFMLSLEPLVDALAAGNTVILKPSAYSPNVSVVLKKLIEECFDERETAVITGGREENKTLLSQKFDYIFFTGSQAVGKEVMKSAANNLTPVTLELGGKSPCIIDKTADIHLAAKRTVFGKYLNCGQTCVAPDYVLCHSSVKDKFIAETKKEIVKQYGENPLLNPDYGKIINRKHFERLLGLIDKNKVVFGGKSDADALKIHPTVMDNVKFSDKAMQEEIFGPIMPIISFDSPEEVIQIVRNGQKPLALYIFSKDKKVISDITSKCSFGGGCVNDTIIHLANSAMGFGGVGESGMGSYHGKAGFDTFSHAKSMVDKKLWLDLPMRYQPYNKINDKLIRLFLK